MSKFMSDGLVFESDRPIEVHEMFWCKQLYLKTGCASASLADGTQVTIRTINNDSNEEKGPIMHKGWNKIKQEFEENPMRVILYGGIAITAVAKLIEATSAAQGRRAYARSVDLRARGL